MSLYVNIIKNLKDFRLRVKFECNKEILGLLGASGCGKSMTLKCIAGIEKPDEGKIILDGKILFDSERKINLPPQKRHVGYLFQSYALFPNMTVRENILCGLRNEHDKILREQIMSQTLELLQLNELINHKPSQLSGGQAQRAALARILVNRPHILMLDEPFSALDTHLRLKLQIRLLDLLKNYGRGVLLVTHDRNEAYNMCDRIAVIHNGSLLTLKDTREFFANPGSIPAAVISGCKNIVKAHKVGDYEVRVPEWNVNFTTQARVCDELAAIGIRAHSFDPQCTQNRYRVKIIREIAEPFERIIEFRYVNQSQESDAIWQRVPKEKNPPEFSPELGVSSNNILLLYES